MTDPTHAAESARLSDKRWIQTFTGKQFWPLDSDPSHVCIEDIAHALSLKCRFTGHSKFFYSVAQHSLLVSRILPMSFKLAGLLHDATEAYLPDIAAPIKSQFQVQTKRFGVIPFWEAEERLADDIFQGLGLQPLRSLIESEDVKRADLIALATEARDVMGPAPQDWGLTQIPDIANLYSETPANVAADFIVAFNHLTHR